MRNFYQAVGVLLLLTAIWALLDLGGVTSSSLVHLYYIPIIISAWFWGSIASALSGAVSGLLAGPLMLDSNLLFAEPQSLSNWLIRTAFYVLLGSMVGVLFQLLRRNRQQIIKQNELLYKQSQENEQTGTEIIEAIARAIEVRDHYTSGHCQRVANMAVEVGKRLGLTPQELVHLRWAGIVHDVGKIGIPEEILNKPGKLTPEEYEVMKRHPVMGAKILSSSRYAEHILSGVRHHHERIDGKGYPDGISGDEISMQARIIAVCDVWDALTSNRSYRNFFPYEEALAILKAGRGTQFDANVLDVFVHLIENEQASGRATMLLNRSLEI